MHATPTDGVQLIRVPLVPWGEYFPTLRTLAQPMQPITTDAATDAVNQQFVRLNRSNNSYCQQLYQRLTPRVQDALRAFARGLRPQQVAEELNIKPAPSTPTKPPSSPNVATPGPSPKRSRSATTSCENASPTSSRPCRKSHNGQQPQCVAPS